MPPNVQPFSMDCTVALQIIMLKLCNEDLTVAGEVTDKTVVGICCNVMQYQIKHIKTKCQRWPVKIEQIS